MNSPDSICLCCQPAEKSHSVKRITVFSRTIMALAAPDCDDLFEEFTGKSGEDSARLLGPQVLILHNTRV